MVGDFEFDTVFPRRDCGAEKWLLARNSRGELPEGVVPMTVADMEFKSPPQVRRALRELAEFGMWGYSAPTEGCLQAAADWFRQRHGWKVDPQWLVQTNNVVSALGGAVRAFTKPGDGVIIQTPVYPPFSRVVTANGRTLLENPLRREGLRYEMDLENLAEQVKKASMLILCSPHNPVGRVWSREELEAVAKLCRDNGVLVVADEIHCDLLHNGHRHTPFAALGEETAQRCIVCTSASKTFSFAGLACANIIIPNPDLRRQFVSQKYLDGFGTDSIFGLRAMEAAYRDGGAWYEAMLAYVWENYLYLKEFLKAHFPAMEAADLQGTYLAWVDMGSLGLEGDALMAFLTDEAALFLGDGRAYGAGCAGLVRINLACPRTALRQGLERLAAAAERRGLLPAGRGRQENN